MESPAFDAVLCDLDGVIRLYDLTEVGRLERAADLLQVLAPLFAQHPEILTSH